LSELPEPPAAPKFELESMAAGTRLVRVHDRDRGEIEFNSSARPSARFRPIGKPIVPTLYAGVDGLVWMSRRFTGRAAVMLWQGKGRVGDGDLQVSVAARALWEGDGRELALKAAKRARIALVA
jgi:hypothetical protein